MKNKGGFNLIELMLVVVLIGIITGIFLPTFTRLFYRNNLDSAHQKIKSELYRAQSFARASKKDSDWGIYFNNNEIILFAGTSYTDRDISLDQIEEINNQIIFSGLNQVVFEKNSGLTLNPGQIILSYKGDSLVLDINEKSLIY